MKMSGSSRLLWVTCLLLVFAGVVAWSLRQRVDGPTGADRGDVAASQREAIEAIFAIQPVKFKLDDEGRVVQLVARGPEVTESLIAHFGALPDLKDLQLEESGIASAGMETIGRLAHLESLRLSKTSITDEDLGHLAGLASLRELFLTECSISDAGLKPLSGLGRMQLLDLSHTQVTDDGVSQLNDLHDLQKLYLAGTPVTGTGFAAFPESNSLTLLNLSNAPVTSEGLEPLRRFHKLESLFFDGVQFDDALLSQLMTIVTESFPQLQGLFLSQTPLTDSAIEPLTALAEMPNLSLVGLNGTAISKAAFRELASHTPETRYLVDYEAGND